MNWRSTGTPWLTFQDDRAPADERQLSHSGLSYVELRQYQHTVEDFSTALEIVPNHAGYILFRGQGYYNLKQIAAGDRRLFGRNRN